MHADSTPRHRQDSILAVGLNIGTPNLFRIRIYLPCPAICHAGSTIAGVSLPAWTMFVPAICQ